MATTATNFEIDNKKTIEDVNAAKEAARNEITTNTQTAINNYETEINKQSDLVEQWGEKQAQLQNEKTAFAIEQINQQKEQAKQDYDREQSGAYTDWQKQSNPYGTNAEQMAAMGMADTGYSESSQVRMYTAYQNRVATATDSFNRAVLNYDNAIKDAQMQNNAVLAEIAFQTLQKQTELSIKFVQRRDELLAEQTNKLLEVEKMSHAQYLDVLDQINKENSMTEDARQFDKSVELDEAKLKQEKDIADAKLEWEKEQFNALHGTGTIEEEPVPEIDTDSVDALGVGTPTASDLNSYIDNNWVEMYEEGGVTKFKLTPAGTEHFKQVLPTHQASKNEVLRGFITENNLDTMIRNGFVETNIVNGVVKYRLTQKGKEKMEDWYAKNPGSKKADIAKENKRKVNQENVITMLENIGDNW